MRLFSGFYFFLTLLEKSPAQLRDRVCMYSMCNNMCRAIQCILEVVNIIVVVCGISLIVSGSVFAYDALLLPGPMGPVVIGTIVTGCMLIFLGAFGYKAAKDRKIEGKELRGKCMLFVYAAVVFVFFATILSVSVVLFVWLGGVVPETGHNQVDHLAKIGVDSAQKPFDNLVSCAYDVCCHHNTTNSTCRLDYDGIPNHNYEAVQHKNDTVQSFSESDRICKVFSEASCVSLQSYQKDVGQIVYDWFMPFAYIIASVAGILLFAWLFALFEICWCCGESDIDRTKVTPEDDDY